MHVKLRALDKLLLWTMIKVLNLQFLSLSFIIADLKGSDTHSMF